MKTKLQLTLKGHDAELLDQATRIAAHLSHDEPDRVTRAWLIGWAIRAVARAVIAAGKMPCPLAVQMRFEFKEEREARCAIHTAFEMEAKDVDAGQLVVLADQLSERATKLRGIVQARAEAALPAGEATRYLVGSRWN